MKNNNKHHFSIKRMITGVALSAVLLLLLGAGMSRNVKAEVVCSDGYGFVNGLTSDQMKTCAQGNSAYCSMYVAAFKSESTQSPYSVQQYDVCSSLGQLGDNPPPRPTASADADSLRVKCINQNGEDMVASKADTAATKQADKMRDECAGVGVTLTGPMLAPDDCTNPDNAGKENCSLTQSIIVPLVNILSMAVGLVVVLSIVIAGIMYITANGNPQQVATAKGRIFNSIIALVVYIFGFALLQWLIPGGVFHG